jgi:hypothetical protein
MGRRHGWHVIVCLDIRRHCRRLAHRFRLRIPWELRDLESRQLLLPTLVVCQHVLVPCNEIEGEKAVVT